MILEKIPSISFTSDKIHLAGMLLLRHIQWCYFMKYLANLFTNLVVLNIF